MAGRSIRVLLAGDGFVTNALLEHALHEEGVDLAQLEVVRWEVPWPQQPFGRVRDVDEACGEEATLLERLDGVEMLLTHMAPVTEHVIKNAPGLRFVGCARGGPTNVNTAAAQKAGILVASAPGRNSGSAAEFALAVVLASYLRLPRAAADLRAGKWHSDRFLLENTIPALREATVGVVGLGAIGAGLARLLRPLVGRLVAADPWVDASHADALGVELMELDQLIPLCDVISLHVRSTPETAGLMNAARIAQMKLGAVLVNTARGSLMNYPAAEQALRSGRLGAMALDVFPDEPLPVDSSLLNLSGVLCTPHVGGSSRGAATQGAALVARAAAEYLASASDSGGSSASRGGCTAC